MGKFKITDRESGKTVIVSGDAAPNDQEVEQIFADAGLRDHTQEAPPPAASGQHGTMDTAIDMARSVPGGLAKGASALAGLPGDLRDLGGAALDWMSSKTGGDPQAGSNFKDQANKGFGTMLGAAFGQPSLVGMPVPLPGSGEINKQVSEPFGGYYDPKTLPGKYAETIASFAPNALSPGSMAARAARVAVPAVTSEAAGQAAKKYAPGWEPAARAAGALGGGLGVGAVEGALSKTKPMSMEELGKAKDATYKAADQAGVVISPQSFQKFATDLGSDLTKNHVVQADIHPNTLAALKVIQEEAASGAPMSLSRADAVRQAVNGAIEKASGATGSNTDLRLATKVKQGLDDYLDALTPADTTAGNAAVAVPILKEARGLAQREFKAKEIQKLIDLAENQASSNYSASGVEQALRAQFKNLNAKLIKDPGLAKSFTPAERAAITRVNEGGPVGNALRYLGKLAPTNVISGGIGAGAGATIGGALGGPIGAGIGAAAVPMAGAGARSGATALTSRNARLAEELMRAGPNSANQGATGLPRNVLLGALLSQASN